MPNTETRLHNMPDLLIAATGSENRRKKLVEVRDWMEEQGLVDKRIAVSKISPDKDAGIEESPAVEADVVAWEKVLVVALALGLVEQEDVPEELVEKWSHIVTLNSLERGIDLGEHVGIFGGDVVTLIGHDPTTEDPEKNWVELLKLNRQFTDDNWDERPAIIAKDKAMIEDLYMRPDGFYVMYKLGIALLGNDEDGNTRGITTAWDIMLKFKPIPQSVIDLAYKDQSAHSVGPRVDLSNLAPALADRDFGVFVRRADGEDELWKPVELEVMRSLVIGGLLPPHMCLQLLTEFGQAEPIKEGKIEPTPINFDISKTRTNK